MENNLKFFGKEQMERICNKIILQAIRDFAFPKQIPSVEAKYSRFDKSDPQYAMHVMRLYRSERVRIIKDLNSDYLSAITNGKSAEIARKLKAVLDDGTEDSMRELQKATKKAYKEEE